jgi:hypothetical protein
MSTPNRPTPALVRALLNTKANYPDESPEAKAVVAVFASEYSSFESCCQGLVESLAAHIRACAAEMRDEANRNKAKNEPLAAFVLRHHADKLEGKEGTK